MATSTEKLIRAKLEEMEYYYQNGMEFEFNQSQFELQGHLLNYQGEKTP